MVPIVCTNKYPLPFSRISDNAILILSYAGYHCLPDRSNNENYNCYNESIVACQHEMSVISLIITCPTGAHWAMWKHKHKSANKLSYKWTYSSSVIFWMQHINVSISVFLYIIFKGQVCSILCHIPSIYNIYYVMLRCSYTMQSG